MNWDERLEKARLVNAARDAADGEHASVPHSRQLIRCALLGFGENRNILSFRAFRAITLDLGPAFDRGPAGQREASVASARLARQTPRGAT